MKLLAIGVSLALAFTGSAHAACSAADQAALEKLDHDWSDAATRGDRKALEALYSDAYLDLTPGSGGDKKSAIDGAVEAAGSPQPRSDFYAISCNGDSALVTHRNVFTEGEGDDARNYYARSIHHFVREGGQWRVLGNAGHSLTDADEIAYLDLEWNIADMKGDKAWFERNLHEGFLGISGRTGQPQGKKEAVAEVGTTKVTEATTTDLGVNVIGDVGMVTGVYHTSGTDADGKDFKRRHRYIDTFVREDGRWRIMSSQGTEVRD
jgi:ketosteroid isomerase-like protein